VVFLFQISNAANISVRTPTKQETMMSELDSAVYVILMEIHIHFRVLCILSRHLRWFLPHVKNAAGRTAKRFHSQAMLQNSICPQNSLGRGGKVSSPDPRTKRSQTAVVSEHANETGHYPLWDKVH